MANSADLDEVAPFATGNLIKVYTVCYFSYFCFWEDPPLKEPKTKIVEFANSVDPDDAEHNVLYVCPLVFEFSI